MLTESSRTWRSGRVVQMGSAWRLRTFESFEHSLRPVADMKNVAGTLEGYWFGHGNGRSDCDIKRIVSIRGG